MSEQDTREKLENDTFNFIARMVNEAYTMGEHEADWHVNRASVRECIGELLDRQAAISKWEFYESGEYDCKTCGAKRELQQQVDSLTAERDDLAHELRRARKAAKRWHELASGYRDKAAQFVEIIETLTATLDRKNARIKRLRGKLKRARNK